MQANEWVTKDQTSVGGARASRRAVEAHCRACMTFSDYPPGRMIVGGNMYFPSAMRSANGYNGHDDLSALSTPIAR